jgi:hypothetical protein
MTPAGAATPPTAIQTQGTLPKTGVIGVRSGLQWLGEESALFKTFAESFGTLLTKRGFDVLAVTPSTLSPLPEGVKGEPAAPPSKLGRPVKGMKLDNSPQNVFFAQSQVDGHPHMLRSGRIPGHVPLEMLTDDADMLDFVILARFAAVSPTFGSLALMADSGFTPDDLITAAGPIRGVGSLGYGAPAPAAPPRPSYGGNPGDYARGYEGTAPNDPWHREGDLKARDFQTRYGPQPESATPPASTARPYPVHSPAPAPSLPKPPLPGDSDMPAVSPGPSLPGRAPQVSDPLPIERRLRGGSDVHSAARPGKGMVPPPSGYALELECYDLSPVRQGKKPKVVWSCTVQQRADLPNLAAALPGMLRAAFSGKGKK